LKPRYPYSFSTIDLLLIHFGIGDIVVELVETTDIEELDAVLDLQAR